MDWCLHIMWGDPSPGVNFQLQCKNGSLIFTLFKFTTLGHQYTSSHPQPIAVLEERQPTAKLEQSTGERSSGGVTATKEPVKGADVAPVGQVNPSPF